MIAQLVGLEYWVPMPLLFGKRLPPHTLHTLTLQIHPLYTPHSLKEHHQYQQYQQQHHQQCHLQHHYHHQHRHLL